MKRFALAAATIALLGLAGCDVLGSTEKKTTPGATTYTFPSGTGTGGTPSTTWWIKGSFDSWKGGDDFAAAPASTDGAYPRHYLESDALNPNLLALPASVVKDLTQSPAAFVLINEVTKVKYDFVYTSDVSMLADSVPYTLVNSADKLGSFDPAFVPTATTYSILVDVAKPTAPVIKLAPGATAVTPIATPTVADLAAGLKIKGDQFSIGWTETAGTLSGNTVTFNLKMTDSSGATVAKGSKTGAFGFQSTADGFLKTDATVTSPSALNGVTTAVNVSPRAANNIKIGSIPFQDSEYKVAVTIDPTKGAYSGRYSMVVTLSAVGSVAWPGPPSSIYFVGKLQGAAGMTEWSEADTGRALVTLADNKAVLTYTATASGEQQFKWALSAGAAWAGLIGHGAPVAYDNSGTNVTLSGGGENIIFTAVSGTTYTITVDYSAYTASNVITVKCTKP